MTLLIVDDEYYSVDGIYQKVMGANMGFAKILKAYSLAQAQACFLAEPIDVMISDIEMPKGSGLELVGWVREQAFPTVCVFLTAFAKFGYASTAIKLESFDYLLKPVEEDQLLRCVEKAKEKAASIAKRTELASQAHRWRSARTQITEQFWIDLAEGALPLEHALILAEWTWRNLPPDSLRSEYFPVLLRCQQIEDDASWNRSIFEFSVKNILTELFFSPEETPVIARLADLTYLIPLAAEGGRANPLSLCQRALEVCIRFLPGRFCFYVHSACEIAGFQDRVRQLRSFAENQIVIRNGVQDLLAEPDRKQATAALRTADWGELLLLRKTDALRKDVQKYLGELQRQDHAERSDLVRLYHDFLQITYTAMDKSGASAHELFDQHMPSIPLENACDSIEHMDTWVGQVLTNYQEYVTAASQPSTAVYEVCQYIKAHLDEELTRDRLAAMVFVSPDYLSHVFREKMSQSLTGYIMEQRVRRAKDLLLSSKNSIRDVAILCGFQNISYFAKQFKRATAKTPQEYRKEPSSHSHPHS